MPRPGSWKARILEAVARDQRFVLTRPDQTASEKSGSYKAAYSLADQGLVQLVTERVDGRNRVVVYPATADAPPQRRVVGSDGRVWRRPVTETRIPKG